VTIRVAIADDQALVRAGFVALLSGLDDIAMVGEAASGAEAVELVRRARPDVMLMDIRMPGMDGLAATRTITRDPTLEGTRVVVLTTDELDE
jgi:DNA-binding NarL/FixJ family response regulator